MSTTKQGNEQLSSDTSSMLYAKYAYFQPTNDTFIFKSKDPLESEKICTAELNAFSRCEIQHKQNAAEECEGFRERYISCQREYNLREKMNDERVELMAQKLYFLGGGDRYVRRNVTSRYDVDQMENRRF